MLAPCPKRQHQGPMTKDQRLTTYRFGPCSVSRYHELPSPHKHFPIPNHHIDLRHVVQRNVRTAVDDDDVGQLTRLKGTELVVHGEDLGITAGGDREYFRDGEARLHEMFHLGD